MAFLKIKKTTLVRRVHGWIFWGFFKFPLESRRGAKKRG